MIPHFVECTAISILTFLLYTQSQSDKYIKQIILIHIAARKH